METEKQDLGVRWVDRRGLTVLAALAVGLIATSDAWAYIDPGAGSYVFQLLIAFFVSMLFVLKTYWTRLCGFVRGLRKGKQKPDAH